MSASSPTAAKTETLGELAEDVREGLTAHPKRLACRFFYDDEGSALFDLICALPEYYLWRAEREILERHADELAQLCPTGTTVVELGSGSASKTKLILGSLLRRGAVRYVPVDISAAALAQSQAELAAFGASLRFEPIEGEYEVGLRWLETDRAPKLLLWLGSNIGNLDRAGAIRFVTRVAQAMSPDDRFLLGVDQRKSAAILEPAYDDAAGVTARFNKNLLVRINRELGGTFELSAFGHRARYDEALGKVDMFLVSERAQRVRIEALGMELAFAAGEEIHTESSYKYSRQEMDTLAEAAGLRIERYWEDGQRRFADLLLRRA